MNNLLAVITGIDDLDIANTLYSFIRNKDEEITSDEVIFDLFKQSDTLNDAYHKINSLFLKHLKSVLLKAVSDQNREKFAKFIVIEENFDLEFPCNDRFTLRFKGQVFHDPNYHTLEYFYKYLGELDKKVFCQNASLESSFSVSVSSNVVNKIKAVVEEGILEPTVDSSGGLSTTIILELSFIKDMARTNQNFVENLNHIWQVLTEFKPELQYLEAFSPDFLVLYASDDN